VKPIVKGTLLSAEQPFFVFEGAPDAGDTLHVAMTRRLLREERERHELQVLYPCSCGGILEGALKEAGEAQHRHVVDALMRDTGVTDRDRVLGTLLAVQFNAFSSGLYVEQAMINHSCFPNAVKLCFQDRPGSFVFATRDIAADEEITITYCGSLERSFGYRKAMMKEQHYIDIEATPCAVDGPLPLEAAEKLIVLEKIDPTTTTQAVERLRDVSAITGNQHLSVAQALSDVIRLAVDKLEETSNIDIALLALRCALDLEKLQGLYMDPFHPEIGNLQEDIEMLLGFVLAKDRKKLFASFPQFPHYGAASKAEFEAKKKKNCIRQMIC
jgi:hypothetical protein